MPSPNHWTRQEIPENFLAFFVFFWPHGTIIGILVPQPGIEPMPSTVEAKDLNH